MDRQRLINLIAAIAAITVFGFALGLMFPLLSLVMEKNGMSPKVIGYNTAMQPLGILIAGFIVPLMTRRWGTKPVAIPAAILTAALILTYPFMPIFWGWFAMRFIQGFAVAILFSVSEAWVVEAATGPARSRIMAIYTGVLSLSFGLGPTLISVTGVAIRIFLVSARSNSSGSRSSAAARKWSPARKRTTISGAGWSCAQYSRALNWVT